MCPWHHHSNAYMLTSLADHSRKRARQDNRTTSIVRMLRPANESISPTAPMAHTICGTPRAISLANDQHTEAYKHTHWDTHTHTHIEREREREREVFCVLAMTRVGCRRDDSYNHRMSAINADVIASLTTDCITISVHQVHTATDRPASPWPGADLRQKVSSATLPERPLSSLLLPPLPSPPFSLPSPSLEVGPLKSS